MGLLSVRRPLDDAGAIDRQRTAPCHLSKAQEEPIEIMDKLLFYCNRRLSNSDRDNISVLERENSASTHWRAESRSFPSMLAVKQIVHCIDFDVETINTLRLSKEKSKSRR